MSAADVLNNAIFAESPAAAACLSELGRRAAYPRGIPYQSAQAKGTNYNATIGQVTDGRGDPLPLPVLSSALGDLDPRMSFLYSPPDGHISLRQAWGRRQRRLSVSSEVQCTLPHLTVGLTHGLNLLAELFVDPGRPVLLPEPRWGNYDQVFELRRQGDLRGYRVFNDALEFDVQSLADRLSEVHEPAVVVLNHPQNPCGFTPTPAQAAQLVQVISAHRHPLVVIVDDAYSGMWHAEGLHERSLFWDLAERCSAEHHTIFRIDGVTKEMVWFSGRVGFITASLDPNGPAATALQSKLKCLNRSGLGSPPGPNQAMVLRALRDPDLERQIADANSVLRDRWRVLHRAVHSLDDPRLHPYPFNSGVFALIGVDRSLDVDALRQHLIASQSLGLIGDRHLNALRIAYCSVHIDDIEELVRRLSAGLASFSP
ncbi:MAG: aspartate/methionine/tyrosine aminotransferase [Kiritimatiellia bacterium]|jgi:aspartate/methionine/tyrosine aminotransferase